MFLLPLKRHPSLRPKHHLTLRYAQPPTKPGSSPFLLTGLHSAILQPHPSQTIYNALRPRRRVDIAQHRCIERQGNAERRERKIAAQPPPAPEHGQRDQRRGDLDRGRAGVPAQVGFVDVACLFLRRAYGLVDLEAGIDTCGQVLRTASPRCNYARAKHELVGNEDDVCRGINPAGLVVVGRDFGVLGGEEVVRQGVRRVDSVRWCRRMGEDEAGVRVGDEAGVDCDGIHRAVLGERHGFWALVDSAGIVR